MNGAAAGAAAAAVWAAQQPLDKRVFGSRHDDVELLGKLATRGSGWPGVGLAIHLANGAAFGAVYALVRPFAPGPADRHAGPARPWRSTSPPGRSRRFVDRYHPARKELEPLHGNARAFAQSAWRHLLFGLVLGELERRLNPEGEFEPLEDVPVASNGHGNIEHAAAGATSAEAH